MHDKEPRRKQRGVNYAFSTCWLSASLRPKGRGIKPAEIQWLDLLLVSVPQVDDLQSQNHRGQHQRNSIGDNHRHAADDDAVGQPKRYASREHGVHR